MRKGESCFSRSWWWGGHANLLFRAATLDDFHLPFYLSAEFRRSHVLRGALLQEYFGRIFLEDVRGYHGIAAVGGIIGPTLAGFVFDTMGNYQHIWIAFSGLIFLSSLWSCGSKRLWTPSKKPILFTLSYITNTSRLPIFSSNIYKLGGPSRRVPNR